MNIFAAIKKSINSNLNKPLNLTLDEIKSDVMNSKRVTTVNVSSAGIPLNTTYDRQVLSLDDDPILSIEGVGRILSIIPIVISSSGATTYGTSLITVDGDIIHNSRVRYASNNSSQARLFILGPKVDTTSAIYLNAFNTMSAFYVNSPSIKVLSRNASFINSDVEILAPQGVPFNQRVDIRLTQNLQSDLSKVGVVVVYELYE